MRRGLVIVISDLLDEPSQVISALKHLRHQKHEVIVFHLLDPAELTFPYTGSVVFRDMETGETLSTQADTLKTDYLEKLNGFIQSYRRGCGASQIDYVQMDTATPFDYALSANTSPAESRHHSQNILHHQCWGSPVNVVSAIKSAYIAQMRSALLPVALTTPAKIALLRTNSKIQDG